MRNPVLLLVVFGSFTGLCAPTTLLPAARAQTCPCGCGMSAASCGCAACRNLVARPYNPPSDYEQIKRANERAANIARMEREQARREAERAAQVAAERQRQLEAQAEVERRKRLVQQRVDSQNKKKLDDFWKRLDNSASQFAGRIMGVAASQAQSAFEDRAYEQRNRVFGGATPTLQAAGQMGGAGVQQLQRMRPNVGDANVDRQAEDVHQLIYDVFTR